MSRKISAREIVTDIRQGLSSDDLKQKYELSQGQLEKVMKKLIEAGHISQDELHIAENVKPESRAPVPAAQSAPKSHAPEPDNGRTIQPDSASEQRRSTTGPPVSNSTDPERASIDDKALRRWERNAWIGIPLGFFAKLFGPALVVWVDGAGALSSFVFLASFGVFFWGCYNLAKRKGFHGAAALVALFSCFGVLILLLVPSRNAARPQSSLAIVAIVAACAVLFVSVMGIVLAIAVPQYVMYKRQACDRLAVTTLQRLGSCAEKLRSELKALNIDWDERIGDEIERTDGLKYFVGSHYGWYGCDSCQVLVRMVKEGDHWILEATALKGIRPKPESRHVVRRNFVDGKELQPRAAQVSDSLNGKSTEWNSYPVNGECYAGSIAGTNVATKSFSASIPRRGDCPKVDRK